MRILVPIDFSPDSQKALGYAIALSKLLQRGTNNQTFTSPELLIFHAFHVPVGGDATFFVTSSMIEREEQTSKNKIKQLLTATPEIQSVPHRILTQMSMAYEGIKKTIKEEGVDLVVMGVRGANEAGIWLGSTTLQVMRNGACPVLAVPRSTEVYHPEHIAFATDLETIENTAGIEFFKKLLLLWRASVDILHVHPNPTQVGSNQAQEALRLDHIFQDIPHTYHFIEDSKPARGIEKHLMQSPTNLLVVVPRHHVALEGLFHKSVTKQLVGLAPLPILSIHEN